MKSKSFDLKRNSMEKIKQNNSFDFSKYYTSAAETKTVLEQSSLSGETHVKDTLSVNKKLDQPPKRDKTPKKKKSKLEPLDISHIDIEGPSLITTTSRNSSLNESKLTSTPRTSGKDNTPKVKSIMKNKVITNSNEHLDVSQHSPNKLKKRNKSVSFMLDDTEEVVIKKTKSNDSIDRKQDSPKNSNTSKDIGKLKNLKSNKKDIKGKENKKNDNVEPQSEVTNKKRKSEKINKDEKSNNVSNPSKPVTNKEKEQKKEKFKKVKKQNSEEKMEEDVVKEESNNNEDLAENKNRRAKKKKHLPKQNTETEEEGEPAAKSQKKDVKPEAIVENLESLSIGDNAHTLTNLLDEMTVAEKDKRKKNKKKLKKGKKQPANASSGDTAPENTEEVKEKVKWQKRKWNKDKKGDSDSEAKSSVIVDNLPLSILCNYKKQLAEHFKKHGEVKGVGVAETYPAEDSKPVFSTSIHFDTDEAALEALKEDGSELFGGRVRVRAQLPRAQTTLVVRSYGDMSDQSVSSAFAAAGRVRSIRHLVKGKKAISTAFVEFDGPDALQKALKLSENARISGKKVHVSKFEPRRKRRPAPAADKDTNSEDSD